MEQKMLMITFQMVNYLKFKTNITEKIEARPAQHENEGCIDQAAPPPAQKRISPFSTQIF